LLAQLHRDAARATRAHRHAQTQVVAGGCAALRSEAEDERRRARASDRSREGGRAGPSTAVCERASGCARSHLAGLRNPAKCERNPAKCERYPAESERIPAKRERNPAKSERNPAKCERNPAKRERNPAKSERNPAKSERSHLAGLRSPLAEASSAVGSRLELVGLRSWLTQTAACLLRSRSAGVGRTRSAADTTTNSASAHQAWIGRRRLAPMASC
jgi:hypothetical protein